MHRFIAISVLCCGLAAGSFAQVRPEFSVDFALGLPQGEFSDHVTNPGFGISLFGGVGLEGTPLVVGLTGTFLVYGVERRHVPFSLTIPDVTVEVETNNNIASGHLVLRLQPPRSRVQPYLDGLLGFNYLFTETTVEDDRGSEDERIASTKNFDDAAFSYGIGAGLKIRVHQSQEGTVRIGLGFRYLVGGSAEYLTEGAIMRSGGTLTFDTERSATDLLVPHLGVAFEF